MINNINQTNKEYNDEIMKKIDSINIDIKSLEESSKSEYVNEGIVNQVRIRIDELKLKKVELEKLL